MFVDIKGAGTPMVLIHGWGMSGKIWNQLSQTLSKRFKLYVVDLPGMGKSNVIKPYSIDSIVDQIYLKVPKNSHFVGWSIGGQIAMRIAIRYPNFLKSLILISTTPCFVKKHGWSHAVEKKSFDKFSFKLSQAWQETLFKFFTLQLMGSENAKEIIKVLRTNFISNNVPNQTGLKLALNLLKSTDLRSCIKKIQVPTLIIAGGKDKLTPYEASVWIHENLKQSTLSKITKASHIPFLSHQKETLKLINDFMVTS